MPQIANRKLPYSQPNQRLHIYYRGSYYQRYIACAGKIPNTTYLLSLRANAAKAWGLPWEPQPKEALWRLINNGIRGAGEHDTVTHRPCLCGWDPPAVIRGDLPSNTAHCDAWRQHACWSCPVAQAVSREIVAVTPTTQIHHIWLLHPPTTTPPINPVLWLPIATSALSAMDHGRKVMYATPTTPTPTHPHPLSEPPKQLSPSSGLPSRISLTAEDALDDTPPLHPFLTSTNNMISLHLPLLVAASVFIHDTLTSHCH